MDCTLWPDRCLLFGHWSFRWSSLCTRLGLHRRARLIPPFLCLQKGGEVFEVGDELETSGDLRICYFFIYVYVFLFQKYLFCNNYCLNSWLGLWFVTWFVNLLYAYALNYDALDYGTSSFPFFVLSWYTPLICIWRWLDWVAGGYFYLCKPFLIDYSFVSILERKWIYLCILHMDFIDTFTMHIFRRSLIRSFLCWLFLNSSMSFVIIKKAGDCWPKGPSL